MLNTTYTTNQFLHNKKYRNVNQSLTANIRNQSCTCGSKSMQYICQCIENSKQKTSSKHYLSKSAHSQTHPRS